MSTSPALAAETVDEDGILQTLEAVSAEEGIFDDLATSEGHRAVVPTDPSESVGLVSTRGPDLEISLPFSEDAANAVELVDAVRAYDNGNGSTTVPVSKSDGSVQITTVIEDSTAPTSYRYEIGSAEGSKLRLFKEGGVLIESTDGEYLGGVAAPWAYDANGIAVDTWYEVEGSTLVQVVAHDAGPYTYPIVADPWIGINLFAYVKANRFENGQPIVDLQPSVWGMAQWGTPQGQVIMETAGWTEAVTWSSATRSALEGKQSMRDQFVCHAYGSPFAGEWNLERWRLNRTVHWSIGVGVHHCNWKTANGV
ncbi:DUF2599 domain-containing protein [Salinibacterium sp.]|uniref:DUF2599 domain-containing protein n=1 Tax=Salinibacterium sp. TaxID=1915057 RepID=UPI00286A00AD|nr:DUF2599 domain-containing protein [Salinibacterium sp.]